jgi:CBS domain containing-hemolysin-like protein
MADRADVHLRDLRSFLAVVDELSFTRAAEVLFVSQPALSKQVRALETRLDAELFTRGHRSIALTEAGSALVAPARRIVAEWDGAIAAVEAALTSFSKSRAEGLVRQGRRGAARLRAMADDLPRYVNTALLLRMSAEIAAAVLVTIVLADYVESRWLLVLLAVAIMVVVEFVLVGVAPRTIGRQHADRVGLAAAGPLWLVTRVLGPLPKLLILIGNAITPGRGFREGPFATEAELRELVDYAEASQLIESRERAMIHSVFDLGDTIVREVMVPRTDVVFIERHRTLRQAMSLALRSGFSRIPVVGENLDDVVGIAYLKDVARRIYDNREAETNERVESVMRAPAFVPDSKPADLLLREMQAARTHVAVVIDEYGGTAGLVTIEDILEEIVGEITDEYDAESGDVERLGPDEVRVSSRFNVEELGELFGIELSDEDVDSVGGLMAKHLGRVPIPGAEVEVAGLRLVARSTAGRRNRVDTVLATRISAEPVREEAELTADEAADARSGPAAPEEAEAGHPERRDRQPAKARRGGDPR